MEPDGPCYSSQSRRCFIEASGVPRGSVLGPTLFLVYANDIPNLVRCKIVLFADDIKLWASIRTSEDCVLLQEDLNALYDWSL
ncbi:uncharacterized protein DEA37_0001350, partial [Paragonimus westermani]